MDPNTFDEFTKAIATKTSRRNALKGIATVAVGSVLGLFGSGEAFAKKKKCTPNGGSCSKNGTCCSSFCNNGTCAPKPKGCPTGQVHCGSVCCPSGQNCVNGKCAGPCPSSQVFCSGICCQPGQGCCGGTCTPLNANPNCGACGNVCGAGRTCCNGTCADLQSDNNNCGMCGHVCQGGSSCDNSACTCNPDTPQDCGAVCCHNAACCISSTATTCAC